MLAYWQLEKRTVEQLHGFLPHNHIYSSLASCTYVTGSVKSRTSSNLHQPQESRLFPNSQSKIWIATGQHSIYGRRSPALRSHTRLMSRLIPNLNDFPHLMVMWSRHYACRERTTSFLCFSQRVLPLLEACLGSRAWAARPRELSILLPATSSPSSLESCT